VVVLLDGTLKRGQAMAINFLKPDFSPKANFLTSVVRPVAGRFEPKRSGVRS
jgi:hypothetical protein